MAIVRVKTKYQVTLPTRFHVGDMLEAKVEKGRITLTPKSLVDRRIAEGLEDIKKGEYGPYRSVAEARAAFEKRGSRAGRRPKRLAS